MRSIVILQARQGSSRLPGKSMRPICGRSMLSYTIESLLHAVPPDSVYLATSRLPENDSVRQLARDCGIRVYSGDEQNVASRYVEILEREPDATYFMRVCGDSPLYDHRILERGLEIVRDSVDRLQVITSLPNRGYPQGMNLEMIEREAFLDAYARFSGTTDFEHVTQYFYARLPEYRHHLVHCGIGGFEYSRYKFSVDTPEEFENMKMLVESMDRPHYTYPLDELFELCDALSKSRASAREAN